MKRYIALASLFLFVLCGASGQVAPDWYPTVTSSGVFVNHDGEEEEIEVGGSYDAPLTVTFMANPVDTAEYEVLYEWDIRQVKNGTDRLLAKRNEEITTFTFTEGGTDVTYRVTLTITYCHRATGTEGEGEGCTRFIWFTFGSRYYVAHCDSGNFKYCGSYKFYSKYRCNFAIH